MNSHLDLLIKRAIKENAYQSLLLGLPPFRFDDQRGSSPYGYDIVTELEVLNRQIKRLGAEQLKLSLEEMSSFYEGVIPCLIFILFVQTKKEKKECNINFDLTVIVNNLRITINQNLDRYIHDKSGVGKNYSNGLFGEINRLCQNILELSGLKIL